MVKGVEMVREKINDSCMFIIEWCHSKSSVSKLWQANIELFYQLKTDSHHQLPKKKNNRHDFSVLNALIKNRRSSEIIDAHCLITIQFIENCLRSICVQSNLTRRNKRVQCIQHIQQHMYFHRWICAKYQLRFHASDTYIYTHTK